MIGLNIRFTKPWVTLMSLLGQYTRGDRSTTPKRLCLKWWRHMIYGFGMRTLVFAGSNNDINVTINLHYPLKGCMEAHREVHFRLTGDNTNAITILSMRFIMFGLWDHSNIQQTARNRGLKKVWVGKENCGMSFWFFKNPNELLIFLKIQPVRVM